MAVVYAVADKIETGPPVNICITLLCNQSTLREMETDGFFVSDDLVLPMILIDISPDNGHFLNPCGHVFNKIHRCASLYMCCGNTCDINSKRKNLLTLRYI